MTSGKNSIDVNVAGNRKITVSAIVICIVVASAGMLFGYDIGISGGVSTMEPFLKMFFPHVLKNKGKAKRNNDDYCRDDSYVITCFNSSLHLAAFVSSLFAGRFSATKGRKHTLVLGGSIYLVGVVVLSSASDLGMLVLGRVLLGIGLGFSNQAAPVYLAEVAPPRYRGVFTLGFNFFMDMGTVAATIVNYHTSQVEASWNWRLSVAGAGVPAIIMTLGAFFVPDTAVSLVERGKMGEAREALCKIRGFDSDIDTEWIEIITYSHIMKSNPWDQYWRIFKRRYRPHLVLSVTMMMFQQLTGVNAVAFYAPVLFRSVGFWNQSTLVGTVVMGVLNLSGVMAACATVDQIGRKVLFVVGGFTMLSSQIAMAWLLAMKTGASGDETVPSDIAVTVAVLMCVYVVGFGCSWGPLSFLIPSEILPTEVRPAGYGISISFNFLMTFLLSLTFDSMFCHLKFSIFFFCAAWVVVMTIFVMLFLPETKGISLETMQHIWERHWYWKRFLDSELQERRMIDSLTHIQNTIRV